MTKGTASMGKRGAKLTHKRCRRCGRASRHTARHVCAHCGFGATAKIRRYSWMKPRKRGA